MQLMEELEVSSLEYSSVATAALRRIGSKATYGHRLSWIQVCKLEIPRYFHGRFVNKGRWYPDFCSYLAHRSGANVSSKDRRAIYATYNCAAEGDLHDQYYSDRQKPWPATHMRKVESHMRKVVCDMPLGPLC
ncbi:Phytanoyl-CoA dioxygenase [Penicillium cf. griseofulvum]|nr:Phytanoyl-CoA dioxygenase [Penicillium cf. griseofulvum]